MQKRILALALAMAMIFSACAASNTDNEEEQTENNTTTSQSDETQSQEVQDETSAETQEETEIVLSREEVLVDGQTASTDSASAVYTGEPILYYQDGTDQTYGEGTADDMHTQEEAEAHTVVTITQPGTYRLSGTLSQGQIAVDLGEEADTDPEAVVTLILDGVDITCTVAPAILFYHAYECAQEPEVATATVDTADAGANILIAANSQNKINGSHVAGVYEEGSTQVQYAYDGAICSAVSMNLTGEDDATSYLSITGDGAGLESQWNLTISGGDITIHSQDNGIYTGKEEIGVATINGGNLTVNAGNSGEGSGIHSNGFLTVNGGTLWAATQDGSAGYGLYAKQGILTDGGTVYALGGKNSSILNASQQGYLEMNFEQVVPAESQVSVLNPNSEAVVTLDTESECQAITICSDALQTGEMYTAEIDGEAWDYEEYAPAQSADTSETESTFAGQDETGEELTEASDSQS